MSGRLSGKVAFITGASSGIGRSIAFHYAKEGALICCADLTPAPPPSLSGPHTHDQINADHGSDKACYVKVDVTSGSSIEAAVSECVKRFGRLDIVVPSAGIAGTPGGFRCHECPDEEFDKIHSINVRGVFLTCKYAIGQMMKQDPLPNADRGWVVNLASIAGLIGLNRSYAYCTSKGGVVQMTKQMALDYAPDRIHVNCLCPGFIETPLTHIILEDRQEARGFFQSLHPWGGGGFGQPQDIAKAAVFLASEDAGWVTGVALPVDGGYTVA